MLDGGGTSACFVGTHSNRGHGEGNHPFHRRSHTRPGTGRPCSLTMTPCLDRRGDARPIPSAGKAIAARSDAPHRRCRVLRSPQRGEDSAKGRHQPEGRVRATGVSYFDRRISEVASPRSCAPSSSQRPRRPNSSLLTRRSLPAVPARRPRPAVRWDCRLTPPARPRSAALTHLEPAGPSLHPQPQPAPRTERLQVCISMQSSTLQFSLMSSAIQ